MRAKDPRITIVRRTSDHGASAARNAGIDAAKADLVCFLDADDVLRPAAIASRVCEHEARPDIVFSFCNYQSALPGNLLEERYDDHAPQFKSFIAGRTGFIDLGSASFRLLYGENPVCTTGTIVRRAALSALGGFDRRLRQAEDWDMWIRLALRGPVAYSSGTEALHTARPGSLSSDVADRTHHVGVVVGRYKWQAISESPALACRAASYLQLAKAELARGGNRNGEAALRYLAAFALAPGRSLARESARSLAVLLGLREGRGPSLDERVRLARRTAIDSSIIP